MPPEVADRGFAPTVFQTSPASLTALDGTTYRVGLYHLFPSRNGWSGAKVDSLMKLCDDLEAKLAAKEATAGKLVEAVVRELSG